MIYTVNIGNIRCLDMDGNKLLELTSSKLNHSYNSSSITADESGNIYVVGEQSNVLIAVSKDGETSNVLPTEQDGLINPNAVYLSEENKLVLLCDKFNENADLYDINL